MFQNIGENLCNMIKCNRNTHPLFRTFGLGATTDSLNGLTRSTVNVETKRWYPGVKLKSFEVIKAEADGSFEYKVDFEGA